MPSDSTSHGKARRPAQAVTSARRSVEQDRNRRMWQYLIAMGIRTVSFPIAVWAFLSEYYTIAWIAVFLAVVIPSFAVMMANAVDTRQAPGSSPQSPTRGLGPARTTAPATGPVGAGEVISGTVISGGRGAPPASTPTGTASEAPGDRGSGTQS